MGTQVIDDRGKTGIQHFNKYSENPFLVGKITSKRSVFNITLLNKPALFTYRQIIEVHLDKVKDHIILLPTDLGNYTEVKHSKEATTLMMRRGIRELLERNILARSYAKNGFWLNLDYFKFLI